MKNIEKPEILSENVPHNNSIGEILSIGKDIPTSADKVYRSVSGKGALDDLKERGVVRNKQSAGLVTKSRWGEKVFWSRGKEGKYHSVQKNGYVIEAPFEIANQREVRIEDVTAIYRKKEDGQIVNILDEEKADREIKKETRATEQKDVDEGKIEEMRKKLGLI